ncbi:MAG: cell division protein ZipA [Xanthomonadales bacterium]|nr:cell division protein ZipA [Xanthomonadales bacterium]
METSTLRWILIVIGVIIIGSIFLFGNPEKRRKPKASRKSSRLAGERREPTLQGGPGDKVETGDTASEVADAAEPASQGELPIDGAEAATKPPGAVSRKPSGPPPDKIVSLFLLARDNRLITGAELLQAALNTGMDFGDMNIFHRLPEGSEQAVFSMANAAKPGHFQRDEWNTFETDGVVLFMTLPGPVYALDAWDAMLATARRMSEILHADLLDGDRVPFTRQKEAQMREEMRSFDRKKYPSGV